jgi:hypothetical protein
MQSFLNLSLRNQPMTTMPHISALNSNTLLPCIRFLIIQVMINQVNIPWMQWRTRNIFYNASNNDHFPESVGAWLYKIIRNDQDRSFLVHSPFHTHVISFFPYMNHASIPKFNTLFTSRVSVSMTNTLSFVTVLELHS